MVSVLERPVFLVGAERSGTTVLRLMLDHHPDITWRNEFEYAVDLLPAPGGWPSLEDYYAWLECHRIFQATQLELDRSLTYPELMNSFLLQHQSRTGKPIVGATVHRHFDRLLRIWPDARFVHILRDGRDVARSNIGMGWAGNVWTGVSRWEEAEHLWTQVKTTIPSDRYVEVTYEALIQNPQHELTRICEFLEVPFCEDMLSYVEDTTYDKPDARYIAQWKRKLSERQIQLVESRIADMLKERGYELSGLPRITVTPALEQRLKIQDWWERFQFRLKRNGPSLFVADYMSRKLGLTQWQKQVRLKLNAIEATYLK